MINQYQNDTEAIRKRARTGLENGALTEGYKANVSTIIGMLNQAVATELVCVLRYRRHYYMAKGAISEPIAQEFLEHSNQELEHADKLALRIAQLGGEPDLNPDTLSSRSQAQYVEGADLYEMIKEDLVAERIAIDTYRDMISYVADRDPTTRRLLEEVLSVEEGHADELTNLL